MAVLSGQSTVKTFLMCTNWLDDASALRKLLQFEYPWWIPIKIIIIKIVTAVQQFILFIFYIIPLNAPIIALFMVNKLSHSGFVTILKI